MANRTTLVVLVVVRSTRTQLQGRDSARLRKGVIGIDAVDCDAEAIRSVWELLLVFEDISLGVVAPQKIRCNRFFLTTDLNASPCVGKAQIDQRCRFVACNGTQIVRRQTINPTFLERYNVRVRGRVPNLRRRARWRSAEIEREVVVVGVGAQGHESGRPTEGNGHEDRFQCRGEENIPNQLFEIVVQGDGSFHRGIVFERDAPGEAAGHKREDALRIKVGYDLVAAFFNSVGAGEENTVVHRGPPSPL